MLPETRKVLKWFGIKLTGALMAGIGFGIWNHNYTIHIAIPATLMACGVGLFFLTPTMKD